MINKLNIKKVRILEEKEKIKKNKFILFFLFNYLDENLNIIEDIEIGSIVEDYYEKIEEKQKKNRLKYFSNINLNIKFILYNFKKLLGPFLNNDYFFCDFEQESIFTLLNNKIEKNLNIIFFFYNNYIININYLSNINKYYNYYTKNYNILIKNIYNIIISLNFIILNLK